MLLSYEDEVGNLSNYPNFNKNLPNIPISSLTPPILFIKQINYKSKLILFILCLLFFNDIEYLSNLMIFNLLYFIIEILSIIIDKFQFIEHLISENFDKDSFYFYKFINTNNILDNQIIDSNLNNTDIENSKDLLNNKPLYKKPLF
jgi:hypothetical protein